MKLRFSLMATLFVLFVGIVPSERFHLYNRIANFDKVMHFLGGFVIAWLLWNLFYTDLKKLSWFSFIFFLMSGVIFIGVLWEFTEYVSGVYLSNAQSPILSIFYRYFHGGDLLDTLLDLAIDMVGALPLIIGTLWSRKHNSIS